ncbi:MAG: hypothetical protein JWL73_681 [Actinomycetia bacterium]|nr:hypothetical protein [Actinomycetes bacterium]
MTSVAPEPTRAAEPPRPWLALQADRLVCSSAYYAGAWCAHAVCSSSLATMLPSGTKSYEQRRDEGRSLREHVPRSGHARWEPDSGRPDPVARLEASNATRLPDLVPVRYGRMLASPFAFLRGAALLMADDLAGTPVTGHRVQVCGDAHLANFGVFATPERNLIFDVNDFDETLPAPWEWDVKRLAASVAVAARNLNIDEPARTAAVAGTVRAYREHMNELGAMSPLDVWYERVDVQQVLAIAREEGAKGLKNALCVAKVRHRTSLGALPKLTAIVEGRRRIVDEPPLIVHDAIEDRDAEKMLAQYVQSLPPDRRPLLERWVIVDAARKVVGVGSVGTRCYLVLLMDHDGRTPLFLQLKEANEAVNAPYAGPSEFRHQGERVVVGQRLMQAASDIFLGWTTDGAHQYYVRQFRDMKGSVNLDVMTKPGFATYARLCGRVLARAHARSGDAAIIGGYLGRRPTFDEAVAAFADAYSHQTERDHAALVDAVRSGRVTANVPA